MRFDDDTDLRTLRAELREWLRRNAIEQEPGEPYARMLQRWHQRLYQGGWVGLSWPVEYGGRGLGPVHEALVNEEIGRAGAPEGPRVGYLGRAIQQFGSDEQKRTYLPGLLSGEDYWCQGFSEPEAGSDLASLRTRAVLDAGTYRLNGQKVWTSYAEYADYCLLLARTGPAEARHKAISAFILPMNLPGIEIRPLRAITGESEFCEVFLTDVQLPESARVGAEGDGWKLAMMTVAYERGAADVGYLSKFESILTHLEQHLQTSSHADNAWDHLRELRTLQTVLTCHVRRRLKERESATSLPGPEMSVDKLLMTHVDQKINDGVVELLAPDCFRHGGDNDWTRNYFYSRAASIYGGTSQIQLNIIAGSILGLPREASNTGGRAGASS